MNATLFALSACGLWAVCTLFVNAGLQTIPREGWLTQIMAGVTVSCSAGATVTGTMIGLSDRFALTSGSLPLLAIAGMLMYPLGTGAYYACGVIFGNRSQYAAQFAKLKPVLAVGLSVLFLGDQLAAGTVFAFALMAAGVTVLIYGGTRGIFQTTAIGWGLMTAVLWAVAEVVIKTGEAQQGVVTAFWSLVSGAAFGATLTMAVWLWTGKRAQPGRWMLFFALHGVVSFGVAYACCYESIRLQGVARTALITAFWPVIALAINHLWLRWRGRPESIPRYLLIGAAALLAGSLTQIATALR